jgi:DNA-binding transcriptional LysR family regulator
MNGSTRGDADKRQAGGAVPDWNLVRTFLAVVENGSLTAAATALGSSQPTVSRQIAELETDLGAALFERAARGFTLTEAGSALVEPARQMQIAAQALSMKAFGQIQELAGAVRIAGSEMTCAYTLPGILSGFRVEHPNIQIEILASNQVENLLERRADIAIRHTRPTQTGLIARHLGDLHVGAFAHSDYLERVGGKIDLKRVEQYDWIGHDTSDALIRAFTAAGIPATRELFPFRCDNHVVGWQLATQGAGVGFAPYHVARQWPQMRAVLPPDATPDMPVWITAHRELRDSPRIQLMFKWLADGFTPLLRRAP